MPILLVLSFASLGFFLYLRKKCEDERTPLSAIVMRAREVRRNRRRARRIAAGGAAGGGPGGRGLTAEELKALPVRMFKATADTEDNAGVGAGERAGAAVEGAADDTVNEHGESWVGGRDRTESGSLRSPQVDCAVCLVAYTEGDCIRKLPCSHLFDVACIDEVRGESL